MPPLLFTYSKGHVENLSMATQRSIKIALAVLLFGGVVSVAPASAGVEAKIDLSTQRMTVRVNGWYYASWKVSTARRGYRTPIGTWRPKWLAKMHYSRKYDNSPMPHSIFFLGGYAIHGTNAVRRLGRPASHGCIRLAPGNAEKLFYLVKKYGKRNTRIKITR
jgi:lipoprotein-anchoring transpeptidase ErfK/SrfK